MKTSIIVSPRERFTAIIPSLESLFGTIGPDVPVIVVEGSSPASVREQLHDLQKQRPFELVSFDYFITPQEARNIGFSRVSSDYVVFTDNDIHYETGWLEALEENAQRYDADLVTPLICIGPPNASIIHHAGGNLVISKSPGARPHVTERHRLMNKPIAELSEQTASVNNEIVEFHCFMARTEYIRRVGPMDERLITREQISFALRAKIEGATVTLEKKAVVTYTAMVPYQEIDLPYFSFRWSDVLALRSLNAFIDTWGIETDVSRALNGWLRPHRLNTYISAYPAEFEKLGKEKFIKEFVVPREEAYVERAMKSRPANLPCNFPVKLEQSVIDAFFAKYESESNESSAKETKTVSTRRPMVVGGMTIRPGRDTALWKTIKSILPQLDRLYLFFDRFETVQVVRDPKIVCLYSQLFGDHRESGKFLGLLMSRNDPYYFALDDQIVYPPDYVDRMLTYLKENPSDVAAGVHGINFRDGFDDYSADTEIYHFSDKLSHGREVDLLGTGSVAFRTQKLGFDVRQWRQKNMPDLLFALECKKRGIKLAMVPRDTGWLIAQGRTDSDEATQSRPQINAIRTKLARKLIDA